MSALPEHALERLRAAAKEPGPGDRIDDRYELVEILGEGGLGVVWAAIDEQSNTRVALKILRTKAQAPLERFQREAELVRGISHPALVRILGAGLNADLHYIVMELLAGCSLAQRLVLGPLSLSHSIALCRRIGAALAALHAAGLVHRDVKPSNIFLVDEDPSEGRLLDYGLVKDKEAAPLTNTGVAVGTPGYMAPEQLRAQEPTGPPADIFALGCVLFECLCGRAAFTGKNTEALCTKVLLHHPDSLCALCPQMPSELAELVTQMLAKDPAERPEATQVAERLQAIEDQFPKLATIAKPSLPGGLHEGAVLAGRYRLERVLGEGGMGIVLSARHLELGKRVALKLLRSSSESAQQARFLREARAASRLESEHVARVLDVGRLDDGAPFLVMEYLNGLDLAQRIKQAGPLSLAEAVDYLLQACEALEEAHGLGIVHRDIKPSNLFLCTRRDGTPLLKILDFGISKLTRALDEASQESLSMTGTASVLGSAWYMSPEQLQDSKHVDIRTDIWSLGVVLHELLTGLPPFEGTNAAAVGARIASAEPRRLRTLLPDAPEEIENIILRCLQKDPSKRYSGIAPLRQALSSFASNPSTNAVRTHDDKESPPKRPRVHRAWLWGILVVTAGLAMLLFARATPPVPLANSAAASSPDRPALPTSVPSQETSTEVAHAQSAPTASASASNQPPRVRAVVSARNTPASVTPPTAPPKSTRREIDLQDPALLGR